MIRNEYIIASFNHKGEIIRISFHKASMPEDAIDQASCFFNLTGVSYYQIL